VQISYDVEKDQCILKVQDTGIGINAQHLEGVFQPLFQAHNPERDREQGLGLGLSIVTRLCALLKHKCLLDSILGQGSTFTLVLPLADKAKQVESPQSHVLAEQLQANILVIDDDEAILDGMRVMLEPWGCTVFTATCIADLEQVLSAKPSIDLVIADYRLPNHELGTDAIERAKMILGEPALLGVIISGDTEEKRMQQAQDSGFLMLHKPVRPAQIRSLIQRLLIMHRR
jgi:CheY-like chemotaxis protein